MEVFEAGGLGDDLLELGEEMLERDEFLENVAEEGDGCLLKRLLGVLLLEQVVILSIER